MEDGVTDAYFLDSTMDNNHVSEGDQERNRRNKAEGEEEKEEGGLIKSLVANLTSGGKGNEEEGDWEKRKGEGKEGKVDEMEKKEEGKSSDGGGGGGVINNLISNIFHHSEGGGKEGSEKENGKEKKEEEGGDGSLLENIASHFHNTDDTAPSTDEASILIHSIIHD